jgi:hypothetical protein
MWVSGKPKKVDAYKVKADNRSGEAWSMWDGHHWRGYCNDKSDALTERSTSEVQDKTWWLEDARPTVDKRVLLCG